jgi:DNA-binding response OmpR family regulator
VSIKILLLEDDMLFAESLIDLLEDEEYEVTHVPNGQSALNASFENRYDLYLLDINVPLINGIELLQSLRDADDTTPTIFLTSHKDEESLKQGFLSGADDFITEPFNNTELLLRLRALLKRSKKLEKKCISNFCYDTSKNLSIIKSFLWNSQNVSMTFYYFFYSI